MMAPRAFEQLRDIQQMSAVNGRSHLFDIVSGDDCSQYYLTPLTDALTLVKEASTRAAVSKVR